MKRIAVHLILIVISLLAATAARGDALDYPGPLISGSWLESPYYMPASPFTFWISPVLASFSFDEDLTTSHLPSGTYCLTCTLFDGFVANPTLSKFTDYYTITGEFTGYISRIYFSDLTDQDYVPMLGEFYLRSNGYYADYQLTGRAQINDPPGDPPPLPTPEPMTLALLGSGLAAIGGRAFRNLRT